MICARGRQRSAEIRKTQESPLWCSHLEGLQMGRYWTTLIYPGAFEEDNTRQWGLGWPPEKGNFVQSHQTRKGHSRRVFTKMWQVLLGIWRSIGQTWAWLYWPEHQQGHPLAAWLSGHMPKPSAKGFALAIARLPEIRKFILIRSQNYHIPVFLF